MRQLFRSLFAAGLLLLGTSAFGAFHLFRITQLYSNGDGSVQFVVVKESFGFNDENLWANNPLVMSHAGVNKTFLFPSNLPSAATANKSVLIGTQGFAALGLVTPDFVVPNGFLATDGGTLNYAGVDAVTYTALPTDGTHAIDRMGNVISNVATNFAGTSASVTAAAPPSTAIVPSDGIWADPDPTKPGTGFAMAFRHGVLVVAIYSYQAGGPAQWYLLSGNLTNNVFTATLDKYVGGQCISCTYVGPTLNGNDGTLTITFTSATTANVTYPGGRVGQLAPFVF